jgi:hypothetical protein
MAYNPLKVLSDLFVKEQAVLKKGLVVSGSISGSTGVVVKKDLVVEGDTLLGGVVTSAGHAQVGALQVDGTFDVAGNSILSGTVEVEGALNVDGQFYATQTTLENLNVIKNASFGQQKLLEIHQSGQNGANNPNSSYVYAGQKLLIKPDNAFTSGSVYSQESIIDLGSVDNTFLSGTSAVDVSKALKNLDDFLFRLNQIIEF